MAGSNGLNVTLHDQRGTKEIISIVRIGILRSKYREHKILYGNQNVGLVLFILYSLKWNVLNL